MKNYTLILLLALLTFVGCRQNGEKPSSDESLSATMADISKHTDNAIYHWKTTFAPDCREWEFLRRHNISRMYVRMFDVAAEHNLSTGKLDVVPIATTKFEEFARENIDSVEIIPTTYITLDALREMKGKERYYAELLVERLRAMASYNNLGKIREMQFDCDWTTSTRDSYFALCEAARSLMKADTIALSSTIRLHQLTESAPPADRGVLMLYNTGNLKSVKTENSILDIKDVEPYLKSDINYPIPLDYVYPTFGWGVKFWNNNFDGIVSKPEEEIPSQYRTIRIERPSVETVLEVKRRIEKRLGKPARANIIYHFDQEQLKHYSDNEIAEIFSCN